MQRINAFKIENGKVAIFQRDDVKSGLWYANFQLGHRKRTMRSLETIERAVAEHKARELYRQLLVRIDQDLPLRTIKFAEFWDNKWLPYAKRQLSTHRYRLHESTGRLYLKPYLGERQLDKITVQLAEGYVEWRRDFWLNREDRPQNCAVNPSKKTLQIEFRLLTQSLRWASREKLMRPLEAMKAPTVRTDPDRQRRHGFSSNEWLDLAYYMESWQHSGRHRLHNTQRALLRRLIWCYYLTGLRRREMETLTWKSIVPYGDGTRAELTVAADTKTGTRTVISQPDIFKYLPERKGKDDLVWPEGWEPHVSLRKLLKDAGLIKGPDGFNRTIYSFRHTYATERLIAGASYEDLSLNMGTAYDQIRKHYSHVLPKDRADKLTRLDGFSAAEIVNATNWLRQTAQANGLDWETLVQQALHADTGSVANATQIGPANAAQRI